MLENALLRQQLIVLQRQVKRPALTWRDRTVMVLLASKLPTWKQALMIVQPDTLLRWHHELFRRVWRRRSRPRRKRGREPLTAEDVALIKRLAKENPTDAWVAQQLREAILFGQGPRFLIRDNDNKYGHSFAQVAAGTGRGAAHTV